MSAKGDKGTPVHTDSVGVHLLLIRRRRTKQNIVDNGHSVHVNNLAETSPPSELDELKQQQKKKKSFSLCTHHMLQQRLLCEYSVSNRPTNDTNERGEECAQVGEARRGEACKCLQKRASQWGRTEKEGKKRKKKRQRKKKCIVKQHLQHEPPLVLSMQQTLQVEH